MNLALSQPKPTATVSRPITPVVQESEPAPAPTKITQSCREVWQLLGRGEPTAADCAEQVENAAIGAEILADGQKREEERLRKEIRYNAFKECDQNPNALYCDRR